jgi:S1-C subfamily serine protease
LNPRLAETIGESEGVLVTDVEESSSAEDGGVQPGDLIIQLNSRRIRDYNDWEIANSSLVVGEEVRLRVLREHRPVELTLTAGQPPTGSTDRRERLGLVVETITPYLKSKLKLEVAEGIVVIEVKRDTPGEAAGVQVGDVIIAFENEEVRDLDDFERVADTVGHEKLSLLVDRRGTRFFLSYTSTW